MLNAPWTKRLRRFVIPVIAAASCSLSVAHAQVVAEVDDLDGIELAPGEQIIKSVDGASGLPVPMFDAQTNQPIVGSGAAGPGRGHGHDGHVHGGHGGHVAHPGCNSCGGTGGNFGCFGGCEPGCYFRAEGLFMRRTGDERLTLSQAFTLDEFDHEWGTRLTYGQTIDCVDGFEATYTGGFRWDLSGQRGNPAGAAPGDPPGTLGTLITSALAPNQVNVDVFDTGNNVFQRQTYNAQYDSFELNRTSSGWDVVRLLYGIRYIDYSEDYRFSVIDNATGPNQIGFLASDVDNDLIGGQVGIDMGYPLGQRLWSMLRARGGVFVNLTDSTFQFNNDSTTEVFNFDEDSTIAGLIEFGGTLRYQIGERLSVSGGYELWYLANVATAPGQFTSVMSPLVGSAVDDSDDVFMHGAVFGAELNF
ncbi:hypothetical protein [Roseimaritima sediminicola]|uniref:hypothetical protein n=1 Tax=Roseimaritima sediminicola TaxID=2662066 RepID=UPI001298440C|nr:hypothetical protein [Roseimaritima sediminicola]